MVEEIDWDKIELDWRAGILPVPTIAKNHGVSERAIKNAAETRGWVREMLRPEDEAEVLGAAEIIDAQDSPRFPIDSLFSREDAKRRQLLTAGQVILTHRKDVAQLRDITSNMTNRLAAYLENPNDDDNVKALLKVLGGKESPGDLLEKLSRVMTRVIALEREAYGMSHMTIDPDAGTENPVAKHIEQLHDKIRMLTSDKAQKKEPDAGTGQDNDKASQET